MKRLGLFSSLAAILAILAACAGDALTPMEVTPSGVTLEEGKVIITGNNFFQHKDGVGMRVEACGVTVPAEIVDPSARPVLLPPGNRVTVEIGQRLLALLPTEGLAYGPSDVRIISPNGSVAVVEGAITCVPHGDAEEEPDQDQTPLEIKLNLSATTGTVPLTVDFDASGSAGQGELEYSWDFGDGASAAGSTARHTFNATGEFTVSLTVTDSTGATATAEETVTVFNGAPTARITVEEHEIVEGEHFLTYSATRSDDPEGHELSFEWTLLPAGTTGSGERFELTELPTDTEHRVQLTVADPYGGTDTITMTTLLDPRDSGEGEGEPLPDLLRVSWYPAGGGDVAIDMELSSERPLLEPGGSMICSEGDGLGGLIYLSTDGDPGAGFPGVLPGIPLPERSVTFLHRYADGTFPITSMPPSQNENPCAEQPEFTASTARVGNVHTFRIPGAVVTDIDLLDVGVMVGTPAPWGGILDTDWAPSGPQPTSLGKR